jgi:hypothetical protein
MLRRQLDGNCDAENEIPLRVALTRNRSLVQFALRPAANARDAAAGKHNLKRTQATRDGTVDLLWKAD